MKDRFSKFFTPKRILLAVVFFCVVLTATSFFTDKLITPLRNAFSYIVVPIQNGINSIGSVLVDNDNKKKTIEELQAQNKELESELESLKAENEALKGDEDELSTLRNFYSMESQLASYTKVGARVIGTTSTNWNQSFTIDQGSKNGIKVDMNVITDKGLVGIVTEVYDSYSVVTTMIADNSNVSAMDERTKDLCIVEGDITLMDASDAADYVQELAGDDANIIFGAMYDENAQDEATITVIATGLDSHGVNTPVAKAMTEFKTPFKAKTTGNTYAQPAAQTAAAAQPTYKAPTFRAPSAAAPAQPVAPKEAPQSAPAQPFRPMRQETQINIPDFLRNKK